MKHTTDAHVDAQVHAIDRMMYLLEERSISRLAEQDTTFQTFVNQLYHDLQSKTLQLQG